MQKKSINRLMGVAFTVGSIFYSANAENTNSVEIYQPPQVSINQVQEAPPSQEALTISPEANTQETTVLGYNAEDLAYSNRATTAPPAIFGVNFSPFGEGQSPETGVFPTAAQIKAKLDKMKPVSKTVRTHGNDSTLYYIPQYCSEKGIDCYVGTWIYTDNNSTADETWNQGVVTRLVQVSNKNYPTTKALIVGNEYLLTAPFQYENNLISLIKQVKSQTSLPVSAAETYNIWLDHPNLANASDIICAHIHPYWESIPIQNAAQHVMNKYDLLKQKYPGKEIVLLEVGWPSAGLAYGAAVPSPQNQERFLREFIPLAKRRDIKYFIFQGIDEPWKIKYGEVEGHWGIFDKNLVLKTGLENIAYPNQADTNLDGKVNLYDALELAHDWLKTSNPTGPYLPGDLNQDSKTNLLDFGILAENYLDN